MLTPAIALVTGANRGIGKEVCRLLAMKKITVLLGCRSLSKGQTAVAQMPDTPGQVIPIELDVTLEESVKTASKYVAREYNKLDILINNAGINLDLGHQTVTADLDFVQQTLETNLFGAWRMCEIFLPLIRRSPFGRIVNVSSEAGSFFSPAGMPTRGSVMPAFSVSKAALNALTVKLATALKNTNILVNAVCPGETNTSSHSRSSGRSITEAAQSIVWAATLPQDGPTGHFFRDGRSLPW